MATFPLTHSLISFWYSQCFFVQQCSRFCFMQSFLRQYVLMGYLSPNPYNMISTPFNINKITSDNRSEVTRVKAFLDSTSPFSPLYWLTKVNVSNLKLRFLTFHFCSQNAFRKKKLSTLLISNRDSIWCNHVFHIMPFWSTDDSSFRENTMIDSGTVDTNQFFIQY